MFCDHFSFGFCPFSSSCFQHLSSFIICCIFKSLSDYFISHVFHFVFILVYVGEFFEILWAWCPFLYTYESVSYLPITYGLFYYCANVWMSTASTTNWKVFGSSCSRYKSGIFLERMRKSHKFSACVQTRDRNCHP